MGTRLRALRRFGRYLSNIAENTTHTQAEHLQLQYELCLRIMRVDSDRHPQREGGGSCKRVFLLTSVSERLRLL